MGNVAGMDGERGLDLHRIDQRDGLLQGARHIGIGLLVEADMGVADLQEERRAGGFRRALRQSHQA